MLLLVELDAALGPQIVLVLVCAVHVYDVGLHYAASASVVSLEITVLNLAHVCDACTGRLRGILFDGASGSISHSSVSGLNQGASGCQAGNANCDIHHDAVGASATQANLAANSVQSAFGATRVVSTNKSGGNSWCAASTVATAVLLFKKPHGSPS